MDGEEHRMVLNRKEHRIVIMYGSIWAMNRASFQSIGMNLIEGEATASGYLTSIYLRAVRRLRGFHEEAWADTGGRMCPIPWNNKMRERSIGLLKLSIDVVIESK